jgi:hypothetical protein
MRALSLFLVLIVLPVLAPAAMVEMPLEQTVARSDLIVQGTIVEQHSHWTEDRRTIVTDVTLRVGDALLGSAKVGETITFRIEGGEVGEIGIRVEHQPLFRKDLEVLLLLRRAPDGILAVQSAEQGRFLIFSEQAYDWRGRLEPLARLKADLRVMIDEQGR